jgi:hypothetical protein
MFDSNRKNEVRYSPGIHIGTKAVEISPHYQLAADVLHLSESSTCAVVS